MTNERNNQNIDRNDKADNTSRPDPGTLHKTDPQENMEGPVSSPMRKTGEQFDTEQNKQEADNEREKNM